MKTRILWNNECSVLKTGYAIYGREILKRLHSTGKYELAELGCYIDQNDPRLREIPWKVYPNLPDKNNQDEVNAYNSDNANQFGAWRFEATCVDFRPHCVCIPPGELVLTKNGYKEIEKIEVGEFVATHSGKFQRVINTFKRQYNGKMYSISFNGCSENLHLTEEHPVLIYRKRKQTNQKKSFVKIYDKIQPEFVCAKYIRAKDMMVLPNFNCDQYNVEIDISDYLVQFIEKDNFLYTKTHNNTCNKLPKKININYNFGLFLGYVLGDGHISKGGISVMLTGDEQRYVDEFNYVVKDIFNLNTITKKCKDKFAIVINCHSTLLSKFLKSFKYEKYIWNNKEFVKGLIRGLVRSDGCYGKNTVSYCSVKKKLAHLFRILCWIMGIPTSIHKHKTHYTVEGYGKSARLLHVICEKHAEIYTPETNKPLRRTQVINGYLTSSIKRSRYYKYNGQVYNLEVENDNSYIVQQSCVHNCDIRDFWMVCGEDQSPFRSYYNLILMPTCDSMPQNKQWLDMYSRADGVFSYQDWSRDVLNKESGGRIKVIDSAPPAAESEFQPYANRDDIKKQFGLENYTILGTVMRNQRRKLFPDLFHSFRQVLDRTGRTDVLLYCHTSYPDLGWNMPELILKYGLASKILFTYICRECGHSFPAFFNDALMTCYKCGKISAGVSSVQLGVDNNVLTSIYNLFDVYLQISCAEGFGIPVIEAAACGTPVIGIDYSAMSDVIRKVGGIPIKPLTLAMELETGCYRAVSDNNALIDLLIRILSTDKTKMEQWRKATRTMYKQNYGWDKTAKKWENYIDNVNAKYYEELWHQPPQIRQPSSEVPQNISNKDFVRWLITSVLCDERYIDSHMESRLLHDINYGVSSPGHAGMYFNDMAASFIKPQWYAFGRQEAYNYMRALCERRNKWENIRWSKVQQ